MAFDTLYLVNQMLLEIGEKTIGKLGTDSKSQRLAEQTIDGMIEDVYGLKIDYKFATTRAELAPHDATPISGYDYMYKIPNGCVRILAFIDENGKEREYKYRREVYLYTDGSTAKEDDVILSDENKCFIKFIVLRTNPARMPAWFRRLVILTGASRMCVPISKDDYRKLSIKNDLKQAIKDAKAANNAEDADVYKNRDVFKGNNEVVEGTMGIDQYCSGNQGWNE